MATKVTNRTVVNLDMQFVRNGTIATRSISFDSYFSTLEAAQPAVLNFAEYLLENYPTFIQPTNWRDSDTAEEEWTLTKITPTITTETETEFDPIGGGGGGGGGLLDPELTVSYNTGTHTATVTTLADPTELMPIGLDSSGQKVNANVTTSGQTATIVFASAIEQLSIGLPETDDYASAYYFGTY